eukprot:TRINITY_DN4657_c0_g1_i8.p1 TRINITY_DN4657_c0_g1~~TRINITY_DN4657_c0_g1_i8.p1  ORF type:complete len:304 (-),score=17.62 TRINITY_DN4657_c0_g1_i8:980-1891(-)
MQLWQLCVSNHIALWCEHVSGERMIRAGVDSHAEREAWLGQVYTRHVGIGEEQALGDARSFQLLSSEVVWGVPPIPMIQWTLIRLRQARVRATVVVPIWPGQAWFAWRGYAQHEMVLSWSRQSPVCVDVSSGTHTHEVNRWQFVAWSFDFASGAEWADAGPRAVGRSAVMTDVSKGKRKQVTGVVQPSKKLRIPGLRILSLFDGAGSWRVEVDSSANSVAERNWPDLVGVRCDRGRVPGRRSRLFYEALRVMRAIQRVNPGVRFVVECVYPWAQGLSWLRRRITRSAGGPGRSGRTLTSQSTR